MKKLFLCVLLVSFNLALFDAANAQQYTERFEVSRLNSPKPWKVEGRGNESNTLSTDHKVSGSKSFKSYLPTMVYKNPRSELRFNGVNDIPKGQDLMTTWGVSMAIYVPEDYIPDVTEEVVIQWHGTPDEEDTYINPPVAILFHGYDIKYKLRYYKSSPSTKENQVARKYTSGKITPGKWHFFVIDIHWDYRLNGNGFVRVYMKEGSMPTKNDILLNYEGPIASNDAEGPYFKAGIYKPMWKLPEAVENSQKAKVPFRLLYYDDITVKKGGILQNSSAPANNAPTVNITGKKTMTLPQNSTKLTANASDSDGSIVSYSWKKISGPTANLSGATSKTLEASNLKEGSYTFEVRVTDNDGASTTERVKVTVLPKSNQSPGARAGDDQSITLPTNKIRVTGSATDSDGTVQSVRWTKISGGSATIVNPNKKVTDITNLKEGNYTFRFTATDNDGASTSDNISIKVLPQPANENPVADAGRDITITLPINSTTLKGGATDSDGSIDRVKWTKIEGGFADIVNDQRYFTEVRGLQAGKYRFRFEIWDDRGGYDSDVVAVNVLPETSNSRPIVNAGADQQIQLPVNNVRLTGTASDNDGTIISRTWTKVNGGNATIQSPSALVTDITGLTEGIYTFRLTVRDNAGDTSSDDVKVTVLPAPANAKPLANAGKDQSIILPLNTVTLKGQASDPDGTIDRVKWSKVNGGNAVIVNPARYYTDVTGLIAGTYTFKFEVWDDRGAYDSDLVIITVAPEPVNERPIVNAGADQQIQLPVNNIRLTGTASDRDGEITEVTWTKINGPAATIQNRSALTTEVTGLVAGEYSFRLTARDDAGETSSDNVRITVAPADNVNAAPIVDAGEDVIVEFPINSVDLNGTVSDDGKIQKILWTQLSGDNATIQSPEELATTISDLNPGEYSFQLTATDNRGATSTDQVLVTVVPENLPPVVNLGADREVSLPIDTYELIAEAYDPDGEIVSYEWIQEDGPELQIWSATTSAASLEGLEVGNYVLRLIVTDDRGAIAEDVVRISASIDVYEQAGIPHVFSPDGNGIDDYWEFGDASVISGCNMVIFNRQGAKIFESNDYANDWDGTLNGAPLPDGDYYYIIQCEESEEPLTGGVRILRQ